MMVDHILTNSMHADIHDIFYQPPTSPLWTRLMPAYVQVEVIQSAKFAQKYAEFERDILTLTAAASKGLEKREISFGAAVNTAVNAVYYKVFASKGKQQAEKFLSDPNPETASKVLVPVSCH